MKFMAAVSHDLSPFKRHGGKMICVRSDDADGGNNDHDDGHGRD
jgi:hypothetical protein